MIRTARWLFLALLAWWTVRFVTHPLNGTYINGSFLHLINLPFHEAGHILFSPFGRFMTVLGGSLMQVLIPVVCAVSLGRRSDWFAMLVCVWWAGQNLIDLAPYIADARALQMVLLGGFTGAEVEGHDWEAILQSLGWLHLDRTLGRTAHVLGSLIMIGAIAAAAWNLWCASTDALPPTAAFRPRFRWPRQRSGQSRFGKDTPLTCGRARAAM